MRNLLFPSGLVALGLTLGVIGTLVFFSSRAQPLVLWPSIEGEPVATWSGGELTVTELRARAAALPPLGKQRLKDPAQKAAFVDEVISTRLAAIEAARQGVLSDPVVRAQLDAFLAQRLYERELSQERLASEISEEDRKASFEAHRPRYERPETWRVAQVFFSGPDTDAKARADAKTRAERLRDELRKKLAKEPLAFERSASMHSDDAASREQNGLLGTLSKEQVASRFGSTAGDAIAALKPGEISEVVASESGFHLFKVISRQAPVPFVYEQVKDDLTAALIEQRRSERQKSVIVKLKDQLGLATEAARLEALNLANP